MQLVIKYINVFIRYAVIFLAILFFECTENNKSQEEIKNPVSAPIQNYQIKNSSIYTTAHNSDLKLSENKDKLTFANFKQPLETEASIYVNPSKQYQTFVGIGAALTDAAAETFYKLNKDQQNLFMEAYFSVDKGYRIFFG